MLKTLQFDTEFKNSNEEFQTVVCGVVRIGDEEHKYWFLNPLDVTRFKEDWRVWMEQGIAILCYAASAETRSLLSLGYTPKELLSWKWIDPYVYWRMLTTSHPRYRWGTKFVDRKNGDRVKIKTVKPPAWEIAEDEWGEDDDGNPKIVLYAKEKYKAVDASLAAAVAHRLGIDIDTTHKKEMIHIILNTEVYSDNQREAILDYCASDVKYLLPLTQKILKAVKEATQESVGLSQLMKLSRYMVCCGIVENNGIPLLVDKARTLSSNIPFIEDSIITECVKQYPFYLQKKLTPKELESGRVGIGGNKWVEKRDKLTAYIQSIGMGDIWPKTPTGLYKAGVDILKEFGSTLALDSLRTVEKTRSNLRYFKPEKWSKIQNNLGSDNRIRVGLMPFKTVTSRHAPKPTEGYIFAMSTWLRTMIGNPSTVIIGADYSAEEMTLQSWVSGDKNLGAACKASDPYVWLAQFCGAIPQGFRKTSEGFVDGKGVLVSPELQASCKSSRNIFKALMLGIGYGMGLPKLAAKLTQSRIDALPAEQQSILNIARAGVDTEAMSKAYNILKDITVVPDTYGVDHLPDDCKATTYDNYHKATFSDYWQWRKDVVAEFNDRDYLKTLDGWSCFENESEQTAANFPIQASGQAILRRAIERCILAELRVISPLHDAIYIESLPEDVEGDIKILEDCMRLAVIDICGEDIIKTDINDYKTDWDNFSSTFTKDKQTKEFKTLGKYMMK